MAAISEIMVREYFELHGFFVRQQRKYISPNRAEEEQADFFVINPHYETGTKSPPFVLNSGPPGSGARNLSLCRAAGF
jgi:hypothetical protein